MAAGPFAARPAIAAAAATARAIVAVAIEGHKRLHQEARHRVPAVQKVSHQRYSCAGIRVIR
eukprot:83286-Chlamydomonas_euryale.AAC.1